MLFAILSISCFRKTIFFQRRNPLYSLQEDAFPPSSITRNLSFQRQMFMSCLKRSKEQIKGLKNKEEIYVFLIAFNRFAFRSNGTSYFLSLGKGYNGRFFNKIPYGISCQYELHCSRPSRVRSIPSKQNPKMQNCSSQRMQSQGNHEPRFENALLKTHLLSQHKTLLLFVRSFGSIFQAENVFG